MPFWREWCGVRCVNATERISLVFDSSEGTELKCVSPFLAGDPDLEPPAPYSCIDLVSRHTDQFCDVAQKRREREIQQQMESRDEETLELKETYSSLQQEVDIKTKKLKKV